MDKKQLAIGFIALNILGDLLAIPYFWGPFLAIISILAVADAVILALFIRQTLKETLQELTYVYFVTTRTIFALYTLLLAFSEPILWLFFVLFLGSVVTLAQIKVSTKPLKKSQGNKFNPLTTIFITTLGIILMVWLLLIIFNR
ncbi:MAG TPA: hypothetical protein VLF39_03335 [Candidatus Saccharimonadales bacterium]|nr:hypothetical protein [Candidatus Saccharimonadales bacterium]